MSTRHPQHAGHSDLLDVLADIRCLSLAVSKEVRNKWTDAFVCTRGYTSFFSVLFISDVASCLVYCCAVARHCVGAHMGPQKMEVSRDGVDAWRACVDVSDCEVVG